MLHRAGDQALVVRRLANTDAAMATNKQHKQSPIEEESDEKGTHKLIIDGLLSQIGERDQQSPVKGGSEEKNTHRLIVEVAERLFRQLGFQKTTVADIARELNMSPANVYRFFSAKSEINAAVCRDLLGKIEAEAEKIAATRGSAAQRLQNLLASVERSHHKRYMSDRKLHELVEVAITENWSIMNEHNQRMAAIVEQIIVSGMAAGEFRPGDATIAARLVNTACIRFCHPQLMVEYDQKPEPTLNQMIGFCLAALTHDITKGQWEFPTTDAEYASGLKELETAIDKLDHVAFEMNRLAQTSAAAVAAIAARGDYIDSLNAENRAILNGLHIGER